MNALIRLLINLQGLKLIRHGLAALGGYLAAQGVGSDTTNLVALGGSLLALAFSVGCSLWMKSKPAQSTVEMVRDIGGALVTQAMPAIVGWLTAHGHTGGMNTEEILFFLLNFIASMFVKPDAAKPVKSPGLRFGRMPSVLWMLFLMSTLSATATLLAKEHPSSSFPARRAMGWKQDRAGVKDPSFDKLRAVRSLGEIASKSDLSGLMPPIYDQGGVGSCTGNGVAAILDYARYKTHDCPCWIYPSRLFIYYLEREREGTVNEDAGAQIRTGIDVVTEIGAARESLWPYQESHWMLMPSNEAYADATRWQAVHGYKLDHTDGRSIRIALTGGYPVVFGCLLYSGIDRVTYDQPVLEMPRKGERTIGGHCMVIVGHDDDSRLYKVRNSWGIGWGKDGYLWMPYAYVHSAKLSGDFWVIDRTE